MTARIYPIAATLALAAAAPQAWGAAETTPGDDWTDARIDSLCAAIDLNEVVVTGTRTPRLLKDTPVATRLITASEIRRSDPTDIRDILQQELPGVEFSYAMNQQVNMNLAGFAGQSVLILVDGERLAGETMDNVDFSRLNLNGVARIEIVRGAASALYGSNAAGGVINIITRQATDPWHLLINARGGAHGEARASVCASTRRGVVANTLDVDFYRVATFDVCLDTSDDCDFRRVAGYHMWNFADRLTITPFDGLDITARAGYYFKERQYNPDLPDRYRDFSGGLRGDWKIARDHHLELAYTFDQYDKSDFNPAYHLDIRDYSNVQHSVRALYSATLRDEADMLSIGAEYMRDRLDSYQFDDTDGGVHTQSNVDILAQYDLRASSQLEIVGALRWDYFSDGACNHLSPKISARFSPLNALTLRAGYASGFRAPSLKEKYMMFNMADIFDIHGNPSLKPELSHNINLGAEYRWRNYYLGAQFNYNFVKNRITTSGLVYDDLNQPFVYYMNLPSLKVASIELTARGAWNCGLEASLSYAFVHEQTTASSITPYCPARPHSLNAKLSFSRRLIADLLTDISLSGRFLSAVSYTTMYMYEPFDTRYVKNPAYTLWSLRLRQELYRGIDLTVAVDNLLNYRPAVYSYNAPVTTGTTLAVGVAVELPLKR